LSARPRLRAGLARFLEALPSGVVFGLGLMAVAVVGMGDELTGYELHFTAFYFLPIWFASWFLGAAAGLALALASAIAWWAADVATRAYTPRPAIEAMNVAMQLTVFATVALLVAAVRLRLRRESALARTDALTGLLNRRGFLEVARREIARAARTGRPLTVCMIDVDFFKEVNDAFGHEAGDRLLAGLGAALRTSMRAVDACARLGGDEFAVLLPDTDGGSVVSVLDRMRLVLVQEAAERPSPDAHPLPDGPAPAVTVSLGAATFSRAPMSVDEMLRAADRMLREVKASGRNGIRHVHWPGAD
jgi:diguanylate cyclase (GGDEF)-like protein